MSHGLAIRVVAEGVESEEQLRFLMRRRCDEAQGNYLGFPVSAQEFVSSLQGYNGIGVLQNI
jgi:EAL domain-containing protein (putative c-di-GMP-specific phosphodiesterase class I)